MFDNFPYTNFHEMNLDWMIKIAKDFLDQYTHIQETITQGLEDLDQKAQNLEQLLQAWYDQHSQDIADQLADALADLNEWYTQHQDYLDQTLQDNIAAFNRAAEQKAQETIESIPASYTDLSDRALNNTDNIRSIETHNPDAIKLNYENLSFEIATGQITPSNTRLLSDCIFLEKNKQLNVYTAYGYKARLILFTLYGDYLNEVTYRDTINYINSEGSLFIMIALKRDDDDTITPDASNNVFVYTESKALEQVTYSRLIERTTFDSAGTPVTTPYYCITGPFDVRDMQGQYLYMNVWYNDRSNRYHLFFDKHMTKITVPLSLNTMIVPATAVYGFLSINVETESKEDATFAYISKTSNPIDPYNAKYLPPYSTKGIYDGELRYRSATQLNDLYSFYDSLVDVFNNRFTKTLLTNTATPTGEYYTEDPNIYPVYKYVIEPTGTVEHTFVLTSGHHGDNNYGDGIEEAVALAYYLKDLLFNPITKQEKYLNEHVRLVVVPAVNAWGYQNNHRCNERGVDLERNYDIAFIPNQASFEGTSGPYAFSEPETLAIKNMMTDDYSNATYYLSMHCRGSYPAYLPEDNRFLMLYTYLGTKVRPMIGIVGRILANQYGGIYVATQYEPGNLISAGFVYMQQVKNITSMELETFRSFNRNVDTFGSDETMIQNVAFVGNVVSYMAESIFIQEE